MPQLVSLTYRVGIDLEESEMGGELKPNDSFMARKGEIISDLVR